MVLQFSSTKIRNSITQIWEKNRRKKMIKKAEPEIQLAQGVDRSRFWWYDIYIHRSRHPNESSKLATPQQERTEKAPQTSSIESCQKA
jgi:hypothetical protein